MSDASERKSAPLQPDTAIAIIGMAGRYPGADDVAALWRNVVDKVEGIRFFSEEELLAAGVAPDVLARENYVRASGVLSDIAGFDAALFGISAREAEMMDPQHRLFLECCWEALEDAAIDPARSESRIGVYGGCNLSGYLLGQLESISSSDTASYMEALVANDKDYLTTRVSYRLNLRGPSVTVGTACSTSAVAVALACEALQAQSCDVVLAGGSCITVPHERGYAHGDGSDAVSLDGHCRAFDAEATGTAPSSGVGVVVLKRLSDALADGDAIYAVIRGYAVGNDGNDKVGYAAPSVNGHAETVAEALEFAAVSARDIGYVEAHGTGTPMGDPIEIAALTSAFRDHTSERGYCAIGSIKSNIGHTSQAAGVAGLIKAALALHHKVLPPTLHFKQPNPRLAIESSPFFVNTEARHWSASAPRRAGLSSLGLGGTNVHMVLEEAPSRSLPRQHDVPHLLPLSGRTEAALEALAARLEVHLDGHPDVPIAAVASALSRGRRELPVRGYVVASSCEEAKKALSARSQGQFKRRSSEEPREVVFVFPGASAIDACAIRTLARRYPVVLDTLREGVDLLAARSLDLTFLLEESSAPADLTRDLAVAMPALLLVEVALARLLIELGVTPSAVIGHSAGEYAAACVASVLTLADALTLAHGRARLLSELPGSGAMLSVTLPADEIARRAGRELPVAAYNADDVTLLTGSADELRAWAAELASDEVVCQASSVLGAAHSAFVEPALPGLRALAAQVRHSAPRTPWISTLRGAPVEAAPPAGYWAEQARKPVRFVQAVAHVAKERPEAIFLEVGPGGNLSSLIQRIVRTRGLANATFATQPGPKADARAYLLAQLGRLWSLGAKVDLVALNRTQGVPPARLPGYPFEHVRYWHEPRMAATATSTPTLSPRGPYLYQPVWVQQPRPAVHEDESEPWVLLSDESPLARMLREYGRRSGRVVLEVRCRGGAELDPDLTVLDPARPEHLVALLRKVKSIAPRGAKLVRLVGDARRETSLLDEPVALARAVSGSDYDGALEWVLITRQAQPVLGNERLHAEASCAATAVLVLPREQPSLRARWVDLDREREGCEERDAECLLGELARAHSLSQVAFRHGRRYEREYRSVHAERTDGAFVQGGRYVLTGGLGRMGLSLAEHLLRSHGARVALVHRKELPPEGDWPSRASASSEVGSQSQVLSTLLALQALPGELLLVRADAGDAHDMATAFERIERAWGGVDGVFHLAATLEDRAFGMLHDSGTSTADANRGPKLRGAEILAALSARHRFSFCVLASSISSEFGGLGNYGYAASNRALDVLAHELDGRHGVRWLSVALDYYRPQAAEDGRSDPREQKGALQKMLAEGVLRGRDLLDVFARALSLPAVPQLVACGQPIEQHVARFQTSLTTRDRKVGRPDLTTAYRAPRGPLESQLVEIWEELLGVSPIGVHDDFFELGGDSLLAMRLLPLCRDRLGVRLTVKMLLRGSSIEQLCRALQAGEQGGDVLALRAPPFARHTLVCVPYAGGTELSFKPLAERLPDDWALLVVPPPRTVKDFEPLLEALVRDLLQISTPLTLYGHCGGSALALELARRLEAAGQPAQRVIAAAFLPPLDGVSLSDEALASVQAGGDLMAFMKALGGLPGVATEADAREAAANMHEDGLGYAALFDRFRAHLTDPLETPLVTLFGSDDPLTLDWQLRGASFARWFRAVQSHHFAGQGHYFVHGEPELVAAVLRSGSSELAQHAQGRNA